MIHTKSKMEKIQYVKNINLIKSKKIDTFKVIMKNKAFWEFLFDITKNLE